MKLKLIIEALLFTSSDPLSRREMKNCLPEISLTEMKAALGELQADYRALDRSFSVEEVAGGFHMRTKSSYAPYILKMLRNSPARLSRAALETLAIVAYKQPVIRQEIERIRGVDGRWRSSYSSRKESGLRSWAERLYLEGLSFMGQPENSLRYSI